MVTAAEARVVVVLAPEVLPLQVAALQVIPALEVVGVLRVLAGHLEQDTAAVLVAVAVGVMPEVVVVLAVLAALVTPEVLVVQLAQQLLTALVLPPEGRIRLQ